MLYIDAVKFYLIIINKLKFESNGNIYFIYVSINKKINEKMSSN